MRLILALVLLPCCFFVAALAGEPVKAAGYRITGVAVSSRDGARIPYCHFEVTERQDVGEVVMPARVARDDRPEGGPLRSTGPATRQTQTAPEQITADVHGRFQIELPGPGRWRVRGFARNFRMQDYDAHDGFYSSIVLTPEAPTMDLVFKLVPDAEITGLVRDEVGDAVRSAQVVAEIPSVDRSRGAWRSVGFAQTDDRGRYEISGLTAGTYRVRVQAQPWYAQAAGRRYFRPGAGSTTVAQPSPDPALDVVYAPVWFPGVDDESRAEAIVLTGGEERQADFQLTAIPATHLKITATEPPPAVDGLPRPQRNAMVTKVSPAGGIGPSFSTTDGTETDFGGLSPGVYEVRQVGSDGRPTEDVRQFRVLAGTGGVVDLGTTEPLVKVKLLADGVPDGRLNEVLFVDKATGRSVSSNSNRMQFFGDQGRRRSQDEGPPERVAYLAPGAYEVYLPAGGTNVLIGLTVTGARATGSTVEIADGNPVVTLHLARGKGEILGRVSQGGKPVGGVMTLLVPASLGQPGDLTPIRRDQTNTDGMYSIKAVVPGRYIVVAIQNGWGLKWQDPATLVPYLGHGVPVQIDADGKQVVDLAAQTP